MIRVQYMCNVSFYRDMVVLPYHSGGPALVAQLDVHPTGDQEVAGPTSAGSATLFRGD